MGFFLPCLSHSPSALLGRAARAAWVCSLHLPTAPKKQPQLRRKQMGGWNLFSTHLIKRRGRSWMRWPPISHLFLCLTEHQSLSKGLQKSFHLKKKKKKITTKWLRSGGRRSSTQFLLSGEPESPMERFDPCSGEDFSTCWLRAASHCLPHCCTSLRIAAKWDFSSPILITAR